MCLIKKSHRSDLLEWKRQLNGEGESYLKGRETIIFSKTLKLQNTRRQEDLFLISQTWFWFRWWPKKERRIIKRAMLDQNEGLPNPVFFFHCPPWSTTGTQECWSSLFLETMEPSTNHELWWLRPFVSASFPTCLAQLSKIVFPHYKACYYKGRMLNHSTCTVMPFGWSHLFLNGVGLASM